MAKFVIFSIILMNTIICHAGTTPPRPTCLTELGNDSNFQTTLANKIGTQDVRHWITNHKSDFYTLVGEAITQHCLNSSDNIAEFNVFLESPTLPVKVQINNQYYDFNITRDAVFDYIDFPTAVLVVNIRNLTPGRTLTKSSINTSYFFNDKCSDHSVRFGSDADTAINTAGQSSYPITENKGEFFLDYPVGHGHRIFPGLLLINAWGWGGAENITMVPNYLDARNRIKQFAEKLQNSSCSADGLAAYIVKLPISVSRKPGRSWTNLLYCNFCILFPKDLGDITEVSVVDGPYIIK